MVQKIFQSATAENDNPDVRDRAYVYWRLLSSNAQIAQNVVLSHKPPIQTTIQSLPTGLLDQLLQEISTLASVYHKPPETFVGHGKYGADAVQRAAIEYATIFGFQFSCALTVKREQLQNARENPLAAAAVAAAVAGAPPPPQSNMENLLDIDFDGAAPASAQKSPTAGLSGLEGLAGTPQRVESPALVSNGAPPRPANNLDDLMGLSDMGSSSMGGMGGLADMSGLSQSNQEILNGFAGLDMSGSNQPPPAHEQLSMGSSGGQKKTNEDLLGLF